MPLIPRSPGGPGAPPPELLAALLGGGGPGGPGGAAPPDLGPGGPGGPALGPGGPSGPDAPPDGMPPSITVGGGPGGDTPDGGAGGPGGNSEQQALALLRRMIDLATQYIQVEPDPEDRATMSKLLATLHDYEAKDQKEADAAMGTGPAQKFMRRTVRSSGP